jgi:hypothetical protein
MTFSGSTIYFNVVELQQKEKCDVSNGCITMIAKCKIPIVPNRE